MAQHVVSGAAGVIGGNTNIDVDAALSSMQAGLDAMEIPELLFARYGNKPCEPLHENHVGAYHGYPVRQNDRNLPLLFGIAYPVCNYSPKRGGGRNKKHKKPLRPRFSRLPHNDMRRHLCGFGWRMIVADNLHSAIFSLAAYTVILCFSLFKTGALAKSTFNAH